MVDAVTFKLDRRTVKFVKSLETDSRKNRVYRHLDRFFGREGQKIATHIVKTKLSGQLLGRRTGQLAQGTIGLAERRGGVPGLRVGVLRGPAIAYAGIHEHGGTIRPKRARALAIPVEGGPAVTQAGVERFGGPRSFPGKLSFIPFRNSGLAVGGLFTTSSEQGRDRRGRFLTFGLGELAYLLVKEVKIKPKHFIRDGFREKLPELTKNLEVFFAYFLQSPNRRAKGLARF
jgi:hypothetical protein